MPSYQKNTGVPFRPPACPALGNHPQDPLSFLHFPHRSCTDIPVFPAAAARAAHAPPPPDRMPHPTDKIWFPHFFHASLPRHRWNRDVPYQDAKMR